MKVAVVGPPHSGKSVFVEALIQILQERLILSGAFAWVSLDLWDNTLGWFRNEPRKEARSITKGDVMKKAEELAGHQERLVLADAPGKITEETRLLLKPADSVIVVSQHEDGVREWSRFAAELGLNVFAAFRTFPMDSKEQCGWNPATRRGKLRGLERELMKAGDYRSLSDDTVDTIEEFARYLLDHSHW